MKTGKTTIKKSGNTAEPKKSLALNSDVPTLQGTATAANKININSKNGFTTATVISVVDGHKGVPIAADALFLSARNLAHAASTASESELLDCGLTAEELKDLQVAKSTAIYRLSETKKNKPAWE